MTRAQNTRGTLRGTVQDSSGAPIASAKIVVDAAASAFHREAISDNRGDFRIDDLPIDTYHIVISSNGFADATSNVRVTLGSVREISATLNPASVRESVTVQGQSSSITTQPIDLASAVHQAIVTSQDLETIPLAARSFANIAYLAPGTEPVEPSDPTKARITAVSTGGSSGLNNELSVDGGDNSDDYIGGFLQNFSPEAIQEFAMRTAQEDADTGRTTAGSVVITTKRGTNDWHGEGAFYERAAGSQCSLSHRQSRAQSQAALLPPELRRHPRRPHHQRQALVFLFLRVRSRKRQHRLQPRQPSAIQRAGATSRARLG